MFPLKNWRNLKRGYQFKERTWYSKYHLGLDLICKKGTPIFAPFDGKVKTMTGIQGGKTIWFYWENKIMRVMHLSRFSCTGDVKEGNLIGYVGNTGILTRGNHAHIDISKDKVLIYDIDNFLDPETFNFNNTNMARIIGDKRNNKQFIVGADDELHWIFSPVMLETFHTMGIINKNVVVWKDNLDEYIIAEPIALIK